MSKPAYWLCLFNKTTWQEFLDAGAEIVGFPHTQLKIFTRIKSGDYIIGYMTKASKWFVVMKVIAEPYFDTETKIWKQASFPCRLKVSVEHSLVMEQAIPALELAPQLKMFDNLKSPIHWGLLFRTAPKLLETSDGKIISKAIFSS